MNKDQEVEAIDRVHQGVAAFLLRLELGRERILGTPGLDLTRLLESEVVGVMQQEAPPLSADQRKLAQAMLDRIVGLARSVELRQLMVRRRS